MIIAEELVEQEKGIVQTAHLLGAARARQQQTAARLEDLRSQRQDLEDQLAARGEGAFHWGETRPFDLSNARSIWNRYICTALDRMAPAWTGDFCEIGETPLLCSRLRKGRGAQPAFPQSARLWDGIVVSSGFQKEAAPSEAIDRLYEGLRPQGTLVIAAAFVAPFCGHGDLWRYTPAQLRRWFSGPFSPQHVRVVPLGNARVVAALMRGASVRDLEALDWDTHDPSAPLLNLVVGIKR